MIAINFDYRDFGGLGESGLWDCLDYRDVVLRLLGLPGGFLDYGDYRDWCLEEFG